VVKIDEFAVSQCYNYLRSFGNDVGIVVHYYNNPFWISAEG